MDISTRVMIVLGVIVGIIVGAMIGYPIAFTGQHPSLGLGLACVPMFATFGGWTGYFLGLFTERRRRNRFFGVQETGDDSTASAPVRAGEVAPGIVLTGRKVIALIVVLAIIVGLIAFAIQTESRVPAAFAMALGFVIWRILYTDF
jgi:membrane protein YqaA with SNARE-associated domain